MPFCHRAAHPPPLPGLWSPSAQPVPDRALGPSLGQHPYLSAQSRRQRLGQAQRCLAACDSLGVGVGGVRRDGKGGIRRRRRLRSTAHRTPTRRSVGATGASRPEGNGLRCRCLGECSEPCGCKDRDAAASDRPLAMGGGFRRGSAAVESELQGLRASPQGASRSLGPGRPPLPFLLSPETPVNRSTSWLISGGVLQAPARGTWQTLGAM